MYLITFYSQFDANMFFKSFSGKGKVVRKPVPRELSSSCGTCCFFTPENDEEDSNQLFMDADYEKVYKVVTDETQGKAKTNYVMLLEKE